VDATLEDLLRVAQERTIAHTVAEAALKACASPSQGVVDDERSAKRAKERAEAAVYAEVQRMLCRIIQKEGWPQSDAEEEAAKKYVGVATYLMMGRAVGKERSYVWRAGINASTDLGRRRTAKPEVGLETLDHASPDNVESLQRAETGRMHGKEMLDRIKALWSEMPPAYRKVIGHIYVDCRAKEEFIARELEENPVDKEGRPRTRIQARDVVDQRIHRARRWLSKQLGVDWDRKEDL
jgi:DNA-directed RNA polymerase specialized sigma24 family protein